MNWHWVVRDNFRFTSIILALLGIILIGEFLAVGELQGTIARVISQYDATLMLQSLFAFNAALISFSAIVYASFLSKDIALRYLMNLILWMVATVLLFLLSVISTFYAFAFITPTGLDSALFVLPLRLTIFAATVFFFSLGVHVVRVRLKEILL